MSVFSETDTFADATYEIPVAFYVTKASNSEQMETKKLLDEREKVHNESENGLVF